MSCFSLKSIVLPSSVKYLDTMAFCYCGELEFLTYLGVNPPEKSQDYVFYGCDKLKEVTVPTCYKSSYCWGYNANKTLPCYLCGDNVVFEFDGKTGLLSISGEGDMYEFSSNKPAPWSSYATSIKKVIVGAGVTSIGSYSFYGCSEMKSAKIGENVSFVGNEAFYGCNKLENVTYEGSKAPSFSGIVFDGCTKLDCIDVPETYESNTFCLKPVCTSVTSSSSHSGASSSSSHSGTSSSSSSGHHKSSSSSSGHKKSSSEESFSVGCVFSPSLITTAVLIMSAILSYLH